MVIVSWIDKGNESEERANLYKLENLGIVKLISIKEKNSILQGWQLTPKGEKIIKSDKKMKKLFEEEKFKEFYLKLSGV